MIASSTAAASGVVAAYILGISRAIGELVAGLRRGDGHQVLLGVTGSGRQIAGLHALTDGVINEIIAHATAAVYFDPKVDTIFENMKKTRAKNPHNNKHYSTAPHH